MRILVISDRYPPDAIGGYERRCEATVDALASEHEIMVLTTRPPNELPPSQPPDYVVSRVLPRVEARGFRGAVVHPLQAGPSSRATRRAVDTFRPDLIYVWNAVALSHAVLRTVDQSEVPTAYSVAEYWYGRAFEHDHFMRYVDRVSDGLAASAWGAVTRTARPRLSRRLRQASPAPVAVCWNSAFMSRTCPIPPAHRAVFESVIYPASRHESVFLNVKPHREGLRLVYVGRVDPRKGIDVAIRAVAHARARFGVEWSFDVVGDGEATVVAELREVAAQLGVAERVAFLGSTDVNGVAEAYARATAVVIPSTWDEPFGLVAVEAAMSGAPIIASRSGALPEILVDGQTALLFEASDEAACAEAMERIRTDPSGSERRATAARADMSRFTFDAYCDAQGVFVREAHRALTRESA